jgi:hypothetical protein
MKKVGYNDILKTRGTHSEKKTHTEEEENQITRIKSTDHVGLSWILKMHAREEIFDITGRPPPSEGEILWATQKFETIGRTGKINLLKYLAYKTGSQLVIQMKGRKKRNLTRCAQQHTRLVYIDTTDEILIIRKDLKPKGRSGDTGQRAIPNAKEEYTEMGKNQAEVALPAQESYPSASTSRRRLMDKSPEVNYLRHICRNSKEKHYPPRMVSNQFEHLRQFMSIEPSEYEKAGDGLYVRGERRFIRDEIIGVYEGVITDDTDRPYVLGITRENQETIYVDADPAKNGKTSVFGKMNEDLHKGRYNAELGEDGFIRILEDCEDEELFTRYWNKYNWDSLKQESLAALHMEVSTEIPGMEKLVTTNWNALKMDKGHLSRWIRRLIEGNTKPSELHGVNVGWESTPKA